jgi:methyl-accepting chemotaxis protein
MARAYRRKNYLIKKKFQLNFLSKFVILLLLEAVAIAALFMYISSNTITAGYQNSLLSVEKTASFFLVPFLLMTVIVAIAMGIAGLIVFVFLSHRIAGPLYRFEKVIEDISGGDLTSRIDLRRTDQLTEIKEVLNSLIHSMDLRIGRIKDISDEMQEILAKKDDPDAITKMNKLAFLIKDEIAHFKVTRASRD